MMNDAGDGAPKGRLIPLGTFEGGLNHLIIPREAFVRADAEAERARAAKALADEKAALAVLQAARRQGRLRRAVKAVFGRRTPR
jgi:hypothetical protein